MSFLYPSFLWALGVLAIPVIVHLFNFRRTTRVFFSNTRFLRQIKETTSAKRKLKHYLILLSRLLALFFLVMAFCQPFIPAREQLKSNSIILYLDNSQSMSSRMDDNTRGLDAGIQVINQLLETLPADTRYKLITNDFAPFSNTYKAKKEISELLTQVRLSPVSRTADEIKERIQKDVVSNAAEIFWISDFQAATFGQLKAPIDSTWQLHLMPIRFDQPSNIFIDSVFLENPFAAGGERNTLQVRVRNDGDKAVEALTLKLLLNNVQAGNVTLSVSANSVLETSFDLTAGLTGLNEARLMFNDFPVTFDNEFVFALDFSEKLEIVEVHAGPAPTVIEKVYGNTAMFTYTGFPIQNVNYAAIPDADVVVLNGLNTMDASLMEVIRGYVQQYGTVVVIPGTKPDEQVYSSLLQLPVRLLPASESMTLDRPDFADPFFENVFEEKSTSIALPKALPVWQWGSDRSAILRLKNGQPFLSRVQQQGKYYVLASPLEPGMTDFYNHALFVPVMYRIAASGRRHTVKPYYTLAENFISMRVENLSNEVPLKLIGPNEVIPSQRSVGNVVQLDIPKFSMSQGFYKVVSQRDTVGLLAFNFDARESQLKQLSAEAAAKEMGGGKHIRIFESVSASALGNEIKERYLGAPLWKYALLMAILFVVAEILLIRLMK